MGKVSLVLDIDGFLYAVKARLVPRGFCFGCLLPDERSSGKST
jgi:hypothetical protein